MSYKRLGDPGSEDWPTAFPQTRPDFIIMYDIDVPGFGAWYACETVTNKLRSPPCAQAIDALQYIGDVLVIEE